MKPVLDFAPCRGTPVTYGVGRRLAIDPGTRKDTRNCTGTNTGWALFSSTAFLVACGTGEPPLEGVTRVVIEVPQAYRPGQLKHAIDPNDLITLAFLAGRFVGRAQARAMPVEASWMRPHDWGGSLPKEVKENRARRHLTPEEKVVVAACEKIVPAGLMNNTWDAIGLGMAAWRGIGGVLA